MSIAGEQISGEDIASVEVLHDFEVHMLSTRFAHSDDYGMWKANAYVVKYTLNLFNNFTWFTTNPTLGDQFHQSDDRIYSGGAVSRTFNGTLINSIVSHAWQRLAKRPFQLRNPRYSVPGIEAAVSSRATGWSKSKMVLQAALDAVSIAAADFARASIVDMPEG